MNRSFKIFLSVFAVLTLVLSFSSCNSFGYINNSLSKAGAWDSVDFDVKTNVQATVSDKTEDISSEYSAKIKYLQSYDPMAMLRTKVTLYGETLPAEVYYTDGSYYVMTNNDAAKLRTGALIEGSAFIANWKNMMKNLPSSVIKSAEEKDNGDNSKTATMSVDIATFETIYQNVLDEWHDKLVKQYADGAAVSDLRVTEPKISVSVYSNNGMLKSYYGECRLELLAEFSSGELVTVSALFQQTLSCNASGKDVTFELPEDYEEYKITDGVTLDSNKILSTAVSNALELGAMDVSMRLTLGAESISVKNIKADGIGTDVWNFAWNETALHNDKQVNSEVYYANGWYYTNVYGELAHLKYERSEEMDEFYGYETEFFNILKSLADTEYKSAVAVSNEDGTRTFTIALSPTRFQKVYGELITDAKNNAKLSGSFTVSDAFVELTVDKKWTLVSYSVNFSLNAKADASQAPLDFSYSLTYNGLGDAVEVTPLEGYETFFLAAERKQEFFGDVGKAIENLLGADSLNAYIFYSQYADVGMESLFKIDKQQESVTAAVEMQTNPKHFTQFKITDRGTTHNEEIYCEDGVFYIKSDIAESVKKDAETVTEQDIFWMIYMIKMLPEKYYDRVSCVSEDGNDILSVELTIEELQELFPDVATSLGINIILPFMKEQTIKESKLAITLNEKNELVSYEVKLVADFVVEMLGRTLNCEAELEIYYEFKSERSQISITPPEGYQDFNSAK